MPIPPFVLRRPALVLGRPGRDGSGLVAQLKGQPHYAQHASAVPRWNDWFRPRTAEQLAELERWREAVERGLRFVRDEQVDATRMQSPVWHLGTGTVAQLRCSDGQLFLAEADGSSLRFGPASHVAAAWSGRGGSSVLRLGTGSAPVELSFRSPRTRGGGGSIGDADAVALVGLPLLAYVGLRERRIVRRRVERWRAALPGSEPGGHGVAVP